MMLPDNIIEYGRQMFETAEDAKWGFIDWLAEIMIEFNHSQNEETEGQYLSQLAWSYKTSKADLQKKLRVGMNYPPEVRALYPSLTYSHFEKLGDDYDLAYQAEHWDELGGDGVASVRLVEQWKKEKRTGIPEWVRKLKDLKIKLLKFLSISDMPDDKREAVQHIMEIGNKHGLWSDIDD